jgi:hypothetical protein
LLENKDGTGKGCKWTLDEFFTYLKNERITTREILWPQIEDLVILTLLPIANEVPNDDSSFELLGFDIMLDHKLKPTLIEVNATPAIAISCKEDRDVKWSMLNDLFDVLGLPLEQTARKPIIHECKEEVKVDGVKENPLRESVVVPIKPGVAKSPLKVLDSQHSNSKMIRRKSLYSARILSGTGLSMPSATATAAISTAPQTTFGCWHQIFPFTPASNLPSNSVHTERPSKHRNTTTSNYGPIAATIAEIRKRRASRRKSESSVS